MASNTELTPNDLVDRVERAPGKIAIATLFELRSAYNRGRITPGVYDWIADKLMNEHRIGVLSNGEEPSQEQEVYIHALDAPIGKLLGAVAYPSDAGLRRLRDVADPAKEADQAAASLETVKAALEDATVALSDYLGADG